VTELLKILNKNFYRLMEINRYSLQDVSDRLGWHRSRLYNYLKGHRDISFEDIEKVANVFGVDPSHLLHADVPMPEPVLLQPTPKEALEVIRKALSAKSPEIAPDIQEMISVLTPLDEDKRRRALALVKSLISGAAAAAESSSALSLKNRSKKNE
jgi:transcriptional regulator with XRE-family HTH domain